MDEPRFTDLDFERLPPAEMLERARSLLEDMWTRRSVRTFSTDPVDRELIETALRIASSAPSGAHLQPWTWVVVTDPELQQRLRAAAEEEERAFYEERAPEEWLEALAPLGTDEIKTHLTDAPYVVVLFRHRYELTADGRRRRNYYSAESCGIAAGFFIAAIHLMGLATLPHTPSPMGFLSELLDRPDNEQAFLVMPVGYPAADTRVPDIERKPVSDVVVWR